MSGSPLAGSGKSCTPLSRMHWANLRLAVCCLGVRSALRLARRLQVLARVDGLVPHRGAHVDPERATRPSRWRPGSRGRRARGMHSANFTALS